MTDDANELGDSFSESLATCLCLHLRKASRAVTQLYDETLRSTGIRSTQLPVLATLGLTDSMTMTRLAEELVMDRTSLARLLNPLVRGGLVEIEPGDDRRTREVALTTRGRARAAKALPLWAEAQAEAIKHLGAGRGIRILEDLTVAMSIGRPD